MKRLVIIDGKSVFYRGYFAMPGLSMSDGTPTGGVFGFASLALEIIKKLEPDYVCVAWDKKGTSIRKRLEMLPTYKAGRKKPPEDFLAQIPLLNELLEAFSWPLYELDDYEADDIMGALAKQASEKGIETCLVTSDLDMLQCVGPLTHVYAMKKGLANIEKFNVEYFEDKYGIEVEQFVDLKALKGDSSDNIPGVPGIGEKGGIQLLRDYKTLDGIYQHLDEIKPSLANKLREGKESAYISKQVAEIWSDAPIQLDLEAMDSRDIDTARVKELLERFQFSSLIRRLPSHMQHVDKIDDKVRPEMTQLTPIDWPSVDQLKSADSVAIHVSDGDVYLSLNSQSLAAMTIENVAEETWQALKNIEIISYDVKNLYHQLHKSNIEVKLEKVHDLRQGAFLLNPLERDRSLSGLAGQEVDESNASQVVSVLWQEYTRQLAGFKEHSKVARVARQLDFPLTYVLYKMEARGIKIDTDELADMSQRLGDEHAKLEQEMYSMAGKEFNIGSPAQLSEVLFTVLELPTTGIKKGKTSYSTGQKELDKLRGKHPIIELIEKTRELAKLKNTYVDTLPKQADEQHRVHTTFNQDVASTGRLSSTSPNLQNIPIRTELGRTIRKAFIPEGDLVFVSADYSQFELRLAAVLSGDKNLINDFNGDIDIHTKTASEIYGVPMDAVTKDQRRDAKVINFGVLYGMGPHALAQNTGMSFADAKQFIDTYFELRAPVRSYIDATLEKAKTDGYVETYFGRRRPTPDVNSSNFMVREAAKRAAANMPIQGTEADLMKLAMLRVDEKLDDDSQQILQIHDSILIECPEEKAEAVAEMLKTTMESICPELGIRLKVDVAIGKNWSEI